MSAPAAVALETYRFEPIGLEELVTEAELLHRVDRKYLMTLPDALTAIGTLDDRVRVLEIDGERRSPYATMYFDTPEFLSYRLAATGRRRRFKVRSRAYVQTEAAYLETKVRGMRGLTVKERIAHPFDAARELTDEGRVYAGEAISALGFQDDVAGSLRPTLHTGYRRTTLLLPEGSRATIDTDLEWIDAWGNRIFRPDLAIVETKSPSAPSTFDRSLWRAGLRPVGISKFATGLAAMRPELPSNKWHRVLSRFFTKENS
ncbi:MAG: polyphosphate polymerase domain-containing protein [Microbacterium sp.]